MTFRTSYLKVWSLFLVTFMIDGAAAVAQVKVSEMPHDDSYGRHGEIIEMTVSPARQLEPVFTHRLTWLPHQTTAGNAATVYMHSLGQNALSHIWKKAEEAYGEEVYEWASYETPREKIPVDKLKEASQLFDEYVQQHIARATKRRECDWGFGMEDLEGKLVYGLHLNGLQETRSISRALALQTKHAILESRLEDAIDLMRMNYRLAYNVGRVKVLVGSLISFAETGITNGNMVEFIATPDSPNMFWALSELPRPVADLRGAFRLECRSVMRMFPVLEDVESATHSPEEWALKVDELLNSMLSLQLQGYTPPNAVKFLPSAIGILAYGPAKKRLIALGMDAAKVEAMPVGKVMLLDANREYRRIADLLEKEVYLPFPVTASRSAVIDNLMRENEKEAFTSFGRIMAGMMLPAIQQVLNAGARIQRDVDALRVIEALRMHAAEHGSFPKSLDEIKVVPVPDNPATRKPFEYRLDGATAILGLPSSDGIVFSKRYKITLR